jgi:hypothetical protein
MLFAVLKVFSFIILKYNIVRKIIKHPFCIRFSTMKNLVWRTWGKKCPGDGDTRFIWLRHTTSRAVHIQNMHLYRKDRQCPPLKRIAVTEEKGYSVKQRERDRWGLYIPPHLVFFIKFLLVQNSYRGALTTANKQSSREIDLSKKT